MARAILLGCGSIVLLVGVMAASFAWWYRSHGGDMNRDYEAAKAAGREFGAKADGGQCLAEALARFRADPGFGQALAARPFLRSCLRASPDGRSMCAQVPGPLDVLDVARWTQRTCEAHGLGENAFCERIVREVIVHCAATE